MDTYYQYELMYNDKSLVIGGKNDKEEALNAATKSAGYYIKECEYSPIKGYIREVCNICYNTGTINIHQKRNKFIYKTVKCPECKGSVPTFKEYLTYM